MPLFRAKKTSSVPPYDYNPEEDLTAFMKAFGLDHVDKEY